MKEFEIVFYATKKGQEPVKEFLDTLPMKQQVKIIRMLEMLQRNGPNLRRPYTAYIDDGIFELRAQLGNDIARVLFFFFIGQKIVLTNGFVKKTRELPAKEIVLAKKYRIDFLRRRGE